MKKLMTSGTLFGLPFRGLARLIILALCPCLFLPYMATSLIMLIVAGVFLIMPTVRDKIFEFKSMLTATVFLMLTGIVAIYSGNYLGAKRTLVFAAMVIVASASRVLMTRRFFERLTDVLIISGCGATVHSIIEYILNRDVPNYRCQALFTNPNFFGTSIAFCIIVCAYKAATHHRFVALYYLAACFLAVGLYLCGSMSLWLVIFVAVLLILILLGEYRLLIVFLSLTAAAVTTLLLIPDMIPRLGELSATIDNRVKIWSFAVEQFKNSPIVGKGFFTYKFLYNQLHTTQNIYPAALSHNVLLDSLLCHGVVGTCIVGYAFIQYFGDVLSTRKQLKSKGKPYPIAGFIAAISIAVALYGMMDTTFVWVQTGSILLFLGSGIGAEEREVRISNAKPTK